MRFVVCCFALVLVSAIGFAQSDAKHSALIDSLKKRTVETPITTDPVSYQDEATFGTFKPLNPASPEEPLDSSRPMTKGWRIRIATLTSEDSVRSYMSTAAEKLSMPIQLRYFEDKYEVLCGNYETLASAQAAVSKVNRAGYAQAEPVESLVVLSQSGKQPVAVASKKSHDIVWHVQIAAYRTKESADSLAAILHSQTTQPVEVELPKDKVWRVLVGNAQTSEEAMKLRDTIRNLGYPNIWLTTTEKK